ncbi:peptidoglycan recognition protein family protein [Anaerosacchariphilus polymeriproducens]|uniref:N-acetylmuramoyl-L-alanine amidase n=1 Tax=Anaerosacchariphilus polymeriproducens TaxID=1812858 RepID=A0A371AWW4_9FIRM|nr:peptidoglycan recognition family protein [Anaerosacchariphilus polymeriproducens]RDU24002.1 N-acetylmuramoyl-L-alanine amidase [Anaerosacchariphilus polymeriproducens]
MNTKRRKKRKVTKFPIKIGAIGLLIIVILCIVLFFCSKSVRQKFLGKEVPFIEDKPQINVQLLSVNEYSRPQTPLKKIKGIVVHYTGNPGTTAMQNRDYFEGLKKSKITKASSHFIIGIEGEIVQCIPTSEISYASNHRNSDTISIECCHPDETGKFTKETYDSLIELTAWLCSKFQVQVDDVIRHYDITGKNCPKYFVENTDAWKQFKLEVTNYIKSHGKQK